MKRIDRYLESRGIKPVDPDPFSNGGSLLLHSKLNEFKTTEKVEPRKPEWAPAMEDWNAWRARPIDSPPWNTVGCDCLNPPACIDSEDVERN